MSKYQPRIVLNNPEKKVPDDIAQQFFMAIKTANVDTIRDFALKYKNKYNIIDKVGKDSADGGENPFHMILRLDDKVADEDTKLRVMKYLATMGAPMDSPDATDVWPIHLAARSQSEDIVNFFIKNKVNLNRKDSSNNTPLHYAVVGKEVACPKPVSIGSIIPLSKHNKPNLNTTLEKANADLIKIIANENTINDNLIHMINTIMKIPDMYAEDKYSRKLEADIINIFANAASNPEYSGGLNLQQTQLDQLIDTTTSYINDNLLKGLTFPLNIAPNNGGWGPKIPVANPPGAKREPTNVERIMSDDRKVQMQEITNDYLIRKNGVISMQTNILDKTVRTLITSTITLIEDQYIDKLIFCPGCAVSNFGEVTGLTKMLYLLIWNYSFINYPQTLANRIMASFKLMDNMFHHQIMTVSNKPGSNQPGYLFEGDIDFLINDPAFSNNKTELDDVFQKALKYMDSIPPGGYSECIKVNLRQYFLDSNHTAVKYLNNDVLNTNMSNILQKNTYSNLKPEYNMLRSNFKDSKLTWFTMLEKLLKNIATYDPYLVPQNPRDDIFHDNAQNVVIPETPLPDPTYSGGITSQEYTITEAFRIMHLLGKYLTDGDFQATDFPDIFDVPISEWNNYIDDLANYNIYGPTLNTIQVEYPEYIFLYRMLILYAQSKIRDIITNCIQNIVDQMVDDPAFVNDNDVMTVREFLKYPFDDAYVYGLLLPSQPESTTFESNPDGSDPHENIKSHKWDKNNSLVQWFNKYINKIDPNFVNDVMTAGYNQIENGSSIFDYGNMPSLRVLIEQENSQYENIIRSIINDPEFRTSIRSYFGTTTQQNAIDSINILPNFHDLVSNVNFEDVFDTNLEKLQNGTITQLNFLTETYGYIFVVLRRLMDALSYNFVRVKNILADIIVHVNNEMYYYIPQIFLPALVKQMVISVDILIKMQNATQLISERYARFTEFIDITRVENRNIIALGNELVENINKQFTTIYGNIMDVVKYHNSVIDFLNLHSAYQLIQLGQNKTRLFNMNLIPLENVPDIFTQTNNYKALLSVLRTYRIPEIIYNGNKDDKNRILSNVFKTDDSAAPGARYKFIPYRKVISYERSGQISNSPLNGENSQLNITVTNNSPGQDPDYDIYNIPNPIAGEWLNFDDKNPLNTSYYNAFIAYLGNDFSIDWLAGMPPSIRSLAGTHLRMTKQRIVEETLQYVIDNKETTTKELYDSIQSLGISEPYTEVSEVKNYIVISKLVDETLNRLITYAIRQSVNTWIYQYITKAPQYSSLTDVSKSMVNILSQQEYLKAALTDIDKDAVDKLLATGSSYLGIRLNQIEPFPNNLPYSTRPTPRDLIHYLYNINYFGQGDVTAYKRCYNIDPNIVKLLITPDTINEKNSDGNTALHLAVNINNPEIVELLLSRGANPTSFKNNLGLTPQSIIMDYMTKHINFSSGITVIDSIDHFATSFNDLLLASLRDEKYANNIIKDVTMAIPIQLIMYNHMINMYLENYQYNFTYEMKNSIKEILKKYNLWSGNEITQTIYPIDLFAISNPKEIEKIIEDISDEKRVEAAKKFANQKKINQIKSQLEMINNQLSGLEKEKQKTTDSKQIIFINEIEARLKTDQSRLEMALEDTNIPQKNPSTYGAIASYQVMLNSIINRPTKRGSSLVEFYKASFDKFGNNKQLELAIWNNYLHKNLYDTPSMIFPLTQEAIRYIVSYRLNAPLNAEIKLQLDTLVSFYDNVRKYIETKASLPQSIIEYDNPMLYQEYLQIIYIINLIVTPAMRNILLNHIYQGFREMDLSKTLVTKEDVVFKEILNVKYNNQTLDSFMYDKLPSLTFKYFTGIYRGPNDPDIQIINSNDLFLPIIQIIEANKLVVVNDNSALIQNIKNYIIPFMANTYQNVITKLRLALYGYERYILNTYQLAKILQLLI